MLGWVVTVEHPNTALVPCWYVHAATPRTIAQFEPTIDVVILYPPQLFGVQSAVATSHYKILPLPRQSRSRRPPVVVRRSESFGFRSEAGVK